MHLPRTIRIAGVALAATLSTVAAEVSSASVGPRMAYTLLVPEDVDFNGISDLGRRAVRNMSGLVIGRSENFVVFADSLRRVSQTVEEAEFAYRRIGQWLDLPATTSAPAWLVSVSDPGLWRTLTRRHGLRPDSLALQLNRELYLKDDPAQNRRPDRIAHEVVHLRLFDAWGPGLPLWLDEGLAGHYGWLIAAEYQAGRQVVLYRNQPALSERHLLSFDDLLRMRRYPEGRDATRAFYRQAEALTGELADRLGPEGMGRLIRAMALPTDDPRAALRAAAGLSASDEIELIDQLRIRSLTVQKP
ncbi:MAG TPA: hypothetical protein PKE26_03215 [Kiritimatiellia bacterium]|nr:hypothetical protein [Kiritimatiellia bacterium]HMO98099.1 hypothetical protein [Kiritimatiellia bacterium]HMP96321.1 hypothetical protein [Kiritimatiellia bacterium]